MIEMWNSKFKIMVIYGEREGNGIEEYRKLHTEGYDCLYDVLFLRLLRQYRVFNKLLKSFFKTTLSLWK